MQNVEMAVYIEKYNNLLARIASNDSTLMVVDICEYVTGTKDYAKWNEIISALDIRAIIPALANNSTLTKIDFGNVGENVHFDGIMAECLCKALENNFTLQSVGNINVNTKSGVFPSELMIPDLIKLNIYFKLDVPKTNFAEALRCLQKEYQLTCQEPHKSKPGIESVKIKIILGMLRSSSFFCANLQDTKKWFAQILEFFEDLNRGSPPENTVLLREILRLYVAKLLSLKNDCDGEALAIVEEERQKNRIDVMAIEMNIYGVIITRFLGLALKAFKQNNSSDSLTYLLKILDHLNKINSIYPDRDWLHDFADLKLSRCLTNITKCANLDFTALSKLISICSKLKKEDELEVFWKLQKLQLEKSMNELKLKVEKFNGSDIQNIMHDLLPIRCAIDKILADLTNGLLKNDDAESKEVACQVMDSIAKNIVPAIMDRIIDQAGIDACFETIGFLMQSFGGQGLTSLANILKTYIAKLLGKTDNTEIILSKTRDFLEIINAKKNTKDMDINVFYPDIYKWYLHQIEGLLAHNNIGNPSQSKRVMILIYLNHVNVILHNTSIGGLFPILASEFIRFYQDLLSNQDISLEVIDELMSMVTFLFELISKSYKVCESDGIQLLEKAAFTYIQKVTNMVTNKNIQEIAGVCRILQNKLHFCKNNGDILITAAEWYLQQKNMKFADVIVFLNLIKSVPLTAENKENVLALFYQLAQRSLSCRIIAMREQHCLGFIEKRFDVAKLLNDFISTIGAAKNIPNLIKAYQDFVTIISKNTSWFGFALYWRSTIADLKSIMNEDWWVGISKYYSTAITAVPASCAVVVHAVSAAPINSSELDSVACISTDNLPLYPYPDPKEMNAQTKIGGGSYGDVYKISWNGSDAAIKCMPCNVRGNSMIQEIYREINLMQQLQHPNIIRFFGICQDDKSYGVIMEYMPRGSLYNFLHNTKTEIPWPTRWQIMKDCACGLNFMHSKGVIHRDVKTGNILLDDVFHAKWTDFGISRFAPQQNVSMTGTRGSVPYMSPEVLDGKTHYTLKADVYSFGVVLWEITMRQKPFDGLIGQQIYNNVVAHESRLPIDARACPQPGLAILIAKCWENRADNRPSMGDVCNDIQQLIASEGQP